MYRDKITLCKLKGKGANVFVNVNFGAKMSFLGIKNVNIGEILTLAI